MATSTVSKQFYLTAEGKSRLQNEFQDLMAYLQTLGGRLSRPHPWRKNNFDDADYEISRDELQSVSQRLDELAEILQYSKLLARPTNPTQVELGCFIEVKAYGRVRTFEMVDTIECNPDVGRISISCPLGKALLGHKVGDTISIDTSKGLRRYRIRKIYS